MAGGSLGGRDVGEATGMSRDCGLLRYLLWLLDGVEFLG